MKLYKEPRVNMSYSFCYLISESTSTGIYLKNFDENYVHFNVIPRLFRFMHTFTQ